MAKQARTYAHSAEDREAATVAFLADLQFSRPLQDLRDRPERQKCPKCGKRKQYYCYDCLTVTAPESHPAALQLPLNVHVVLHPGESRSKATTLPIATVSPQVSIHTYPTVPDLNPSTTLVLYPSSSSVEIDDISDVESVTDVVFVDSTWQQSRAIAADERVTRFRHVKLSGIVSLFWRFQDRDPYHLATVEAVYHTVRRLAAARKRAGAPAGSAPPRVLSADDAAKRKIMGGVPELDAWYEGEVDDLLFYYTNQYVLIQQSYQSGERSFTDKHFDGYVLRHVDWEALLKASRGRLAGAAFRNPATTQQQPSDGTPAVAAADGSNDETQVRPPQPRPEQP